jgi:spermidine synthase
MLGSGAAALVYEVVWLRLLSLVMGSTAYALSAMLTAFLGGLALGAWIAGRASQSRGASLRAYAALEIGIALLAGAMPALVAAAAPLFGAAYRALGESLLAYSVAQLAIAGALLLVPTALMGATLPVLTAAVVREAGGLAGRVGDLYGANSLGGALGAALCGFLLLPELGMRATSWVAAGLNAAVALAALAAARLPAARPTAPDALPQPSLPEPRAAPASDHPAPPPLAVALLYAVSGFATLALEVAWARVVGLSIGSTSYGFAVTLSSFILGIALGSLAAARAGWLWRRPVRSIAWLHFAIALSATLSIGWLARLPIFVVSIFGDPDATFAGLLARQLLLVGATILVPTLAMGAIFPLVTEVLHRGAAPPGRAVGSTYAANTWGTIVGSFAAGFVLVPWIGMRATIAVSAGLSALVGLAWLAPALRAGRAGAALEAAFALAGVALLVAAAPGFDPAILTSGPYLYGRALAERMPAGGSLEEIARAWSRALGELVEWREGASGVVSLRRRGSKLSLQMGGKSDAYSYASTQNLIAHLPLLLQGGARDVLVIGLGSASTLGSALTHPVERVDAVEISPEVLDFARRYFAPYNGGALDDPRARVRIGDGRNHLRHSGRDYDVIVSQPSNPWISGSAALFTREFFQELRAHLRPGGIACVWFVATDEEGRALRSILRTFSEAFEHAYLFESLLLGEYLLIGARDAPAWSGAAISERLRATRAGADLARLGPLGAPELAGLLLLGPEGVRRFGARGVRNTDDGAHLEFLGPRLLAMRDRLRAQRELEALRPRALDFFAEARVAGQDPEARRFAERLDAIGRSKPLVLEAREIEAREGRGAAWRAVALRAAELNPADPYVSALARADATRAP